MTRLVLLFLGALAAVTFAAFILVALPRLDLPVAPAYQPLTPYTASESPLQPYTESELRGRKVYIANGCIYCHSQQIRDPSFTNDVDRGWGRPSYPSDYIYDSPALLGTMRTGPDLINVGVRLPDRNWQLVHLFQPRALRSWSIMPSFSFLFQIKDHAEDGDVVVPVPDAWKPKGKTVVATPEALDLTDYLLSLKRNFTPPELKLEKQKQEKGESSQ